MMTNTTTHTTELPYQATQLSQSPNVWELKHFLSDAECDHLIAVARHRQEPSLGFDVETGESTKVAIRTSSQTFLQIKEDPVVAAIEERISALLNVPVDHGEGMQVLRYQVGEEYKAHFDYFDPRFPGSEVSLARGGQRVATVLMYLTDNDAGGETAFPLIDLKIPPRKGHAVLFFSVHPNGEVDNRSLHASLPVIEGEKWVATKWLRERTFV